MKQAAIYLLSILVLVVGALVLSLLHPGVRSAVADEFKDVRVINPVTMPVNVRDAENPARQPVQAEATCFDDTGGGCLVPIYTVPAGKRLVIEYAGMRARLTQALHPKMDIRTTVDGHAILHYLPQAPAQPALNTETAIGQQVRLYADPETTVSVIGLPSNLSSSGSYTFSISGYLVDVQ